MLRSGSTEPDRGSGFCVPEPLSLPRSARRRRIKPLLGTASYIRRGRSRCFVCAIADDDPAYPHHVVHRDDDHIAFLAREATLWGHVLVAPRSHREEVTTAFTGDEYLRLQRLVQVIGNAVAGAVPCDRLYILSLGSRQLNRHVHWHVAPLPPGIPLARQQLRAFSRVLAGVIECPEVEWARLAGRIRDGIVV
jgi:diadenosine tetraphosphate (Ap4A) HIT family hydrolase